MDNSDEEARIVYRDGDEVRALRGVITKQDKYFIYLHRRNGDYRIGKSFIVEMKKAGVL